MGQFEPHQQTGTAQQRPNVGSGEHSFNPTSSKRIASASSATQDVYANADGTYTRQVHPGRVNFRAADGTWTPIDSTLTRRKDGRLAQKASDVGADFASSANDPALVTLATDSAHAVSFGLQGAAAVPAAMKGDGATYPGALPGVDLVESPTADGVKESLVLQSVDAGNTWVFPLHLKGLTARMASDGSVELVDGAGTVSQTMPHGFMQDSKIDARSGLPAMSAGVTYSLETAADGSAALRVTADQAWLSDPARVYPVTVDPTTVLKTSSSTYVESGVPGPHNAEPQVAAGTFDGGTHKARAYLAFSGFEDIYAGQRMTSVTLTVFDSWAATCTADTTFNVGQITDPWTPSSPTTYPGLAIGGSNTAPASIGSWTGKAPPAACGNKTKDPTVGGFITTAPLVLDTFHSWIARTSVNRGLALFASESDNNQWKLFDSNAKIAQQPYLNVTYTPDVAPQVDAQYPPDNYSATSLTPELLGYGHDPDNAPNSLKYQFTVFNSANAQVAQSALQSSGSWVVPSGKLAWGQTYYWTVQSFDGVSYSSTAPRWHALSTPVPQPLVTSGLSQSAEGHGFEPSAGNYTTSATDADVDTVGPDLSVKRDYNSLDGRVGQAFGSGWSSVYDAKATEVKDTAGTVQTVVVTYPDGQDVAFGRNANGSFTPPQGRFATFAAVTGGYSLTDKNGVVYRFTQSTTTGVYGISSIADASGRTESFTYTGMQITQATAASGRHLSFTWATPPGAAIAHVTAVSTDPATVGNSDTVSTWTYAYSGDQLASVCPPTSATACTTYASTASTPYPATVLGADPASYWRLGDASGASRAASSVLANEGTDNATYSNVTLGQSGSLPGSTATAAGFNGTSSAVNVLSQLQLTATYQAIGMRFKTTATNGVLFSYQQDPLSKGTTSANYSPALYVGADGKLQGEFWTGGGLPVATTAAVNDGAWHEVLLSAAGNTQTLYLDGVAIGAKSGQIAFINSYSTANVYVGAGYLGGSWPDQTRSSGAALPTYFNGSISDVAFYDHSVTGATAGVLAAAGKTQAKVLTKVTRPSGTVYAQIGYDTAAARVAQVTDEDGAVWKLGAPTVSGSSRVYASSVLGAGPRDYWRFAEQSATDAVNEVNGDTITYTGGVSLSNSGGPFTDATVATFDGTTGYANAATPLIVDGGNQSISAWFKTTTAGGVLASYHNADLSAGSATIYVPLLYVGSDGKLRGQYWDGGATPITSAAAVTDGQWHHVVLAAGTANQTLYLDSVVVGTKTGTVAPSSGAHSEIGAGYTSVGWPASGSSAGYGVPKFFKGSIGEVAVFRSQLSAAQVSQQYSAARASTGTVPATTVTVTDPTNKTISYVSDPMNGNRPLAETDALGNITKYGYDTSGFLYTVTDPNGNVTTTGHDVRGNTVSQATCQDRSANRCSTVYFTYYPDDTSATLTPDPRNDVVLTVRDGRSASASDNTYLTSYSYDANGNRTQVVTPPVLTGSATTAASRTTTTAYTTSSTAAVGGGSTQVGLPASVTTAGGAVTSYGYYANGDLAQVGDPAGLVTSFGYDNLGQQVTSKVVSDSYPAGVTTTQVHDKAGQVVSETAPAVTDRVSGAVHTAVATTVFDVNGNVTSQSVADATGGDASRTVSTTYDTHDRKATSTDATGGVTSYGYDVYGNVGSQVDPSGTETDYEHDAEGRLLNTTVIGYTGDPLNPQAPTNVRESTRAYDPAGRLAQITDAMGRVTAYTYTDDGLLASVTRKDIAPSTASFVVQSSTYDAAGNLVSQTTNNGATTVTTSVDAANRTTSSTADPTGLARTTAYSYTADDGVATTRLTDGSASWSTVTNTYDSADRLTARALTGSVNPGTTRTTSWTLDKRGLPTATTDPAGNLTNYTFDEAGQSVVKVEPAINTETGGGTPVSTRPITTTGYNAFGEVAEVSDPNGNTTTVAYDAAGRRTSTTLPSYTPPGAGTAVTATTATTYNSAGQVTSQTDALGHKTTYTYDQLGDLAATTAPNNAVTHTTFDLAGEALSVTDGSGAVSQATYDFLGRKVTGTQQVRQPSAATYTTTYGYAPTGGWLSSVKTPAGVTSSKTFNAVGETASVIDGAGNTTRYGYDFAGRQVWTTLADSTSHVTGYDDAGNPITAADKDAGGATVRTTAAAYDAAGNLTSTTDARANTSTFSYDAAGQVTSETQAAGGAASLPGAAWSPGMSTAHSVTVKGLTPGTAYSYRVASTDVSGHTSISPDPVSAPASTTTTGTAPTCPCSVFAPGATPGTSDDGDTSSVEVGMKVTPTADGTITGVKFYKAAANTGTHTATLWSPTGTVLATGTFANETASGWQTLTFATPVPVTAGTTYTASYLAPNGHYAGDNNYFGADVVNGPLTAPAAGNGVYVYGSGGVLPTSTYQGSNYWVDVTFQPGPAAANAPAAPTCPCTVFAATATPGTPDAGDGAAVTVGVKVIPATNGTITGIKFYKATTNTGTHIGTLWSATGTALATGTFSNETASGWQTLTFATPVAVTAGTTYVASTFDPGGHYSHDANAFTTDVVNGPLTAPAAGGNGVFAYGATSTFPAGTFQASNYWVDVTYAPTATTGNPAVSAVNATPVGGTATITWTTDRPTTSAVSYGLASAAASTITTTFGYDAAGNRTRFTDGRANAFLTAYNTWNLPQSQIEPATPAYPNPVDRTYTAGYDANGQITKVTQPGGVTTTNTYDTLGDLTAAAGTGADAATTARTFGYDPTGRMTSASAPAGSDTFGYDDRGLLLTATGPSGASTFTYNGDGQMASRADAAGTTSYGYDTAGRLSTLSDPITAGTATYSYNTLNLPTQVSYGAGKNTRSYGYDPLHRLTGDTLKTTGGATIAGISYTYDANDNLTAKTTTGVTGAAANTYSYDAANRLTSWNNGTTTTAYTYDASGNRTRAGAATFTYNARNQVTGDATHTYAYTARGTLSSVTAGGTAVPSTFDAFGQAVTQGTRTYAYDALGRVVTASGGASGTATLAYTGTANTVASDGSATYSRDPSDGLVAVHTSGGNVLAWTDQHDDVIAQFTAAGTTLSGSTTYDPFGAVTATTGMKGNLGYQSGWTDPTTNRVDMAARWYDPASGQFISRDAVALNPVPTSVSANRYAYVNDNPLAGTDPLGTFSLSSITSGISAAWNATTSAVSTAWNYGTSAVSTGLSYMDDGARFVYNQGVKAVKVVVKQTVRLAKTTVHKVADAYHYAKKTVKKALKVVKQVTTRVARAAVKHVKAAVHAVKTATRAVTHAVATAAKATGKFVQHHAGAIAAVVVGVAVFAGCEAATLGAGSIGCAALAGAAAGAAGNLADVAAGNKKFSWKSLAIDTGVGAALGGLTAGLGSGAAGLLGRAGSKLAGTALGDTMSAGGGRLASSALGRGAASVGRAMDTMTAPARTLGTKIGAGLRGGMDGGGSEAGGAEAAGSLRARATSEADDNAGASCFHSFAPATRVVMADGTTKAISQIKLGDQVLATNALNGKTEAKSVVALHHNHDTDLADVTVRIPTPRTPTDKTTVATTEPTHPTLMKGAAQARAPNAAVGATVAGTAVSTVTVTLHTTWHHPFWNQTSGTWTEAADLTPGDTLHALDNSNATVVAVHTWTGAADMNDLTIDDTHTYYVLTANTPVLVHNCDPDLGTRADMANSGMTPARGGKADTTSAGLEYDKHQLMQGQDSPKRFLPRVGGNAADLDSAGQKLLDDITFHPQGFAEPVTGGAFVGGARIVRPDGVGAVFTSNNTFAYFGKFKYNG